MEDCDTCHASGECQDCMGEGDEDCPTCIGSGICDECGGNGEVESESEYLGMCESCSIRIYDGDKHSVTIDGCTLCAEHSPMLSDCVHQMERHLAEEGDHAFHAYECANQAEFLSDIASLKDRIASDGDSSTAST